MTPPTSTIAPSLAIETRGLSQVFLTKDGPVHALEEIDLTVRQGEFVSIVGPSGCGKSTLLRLVAGLQSHTFGDVEYEGRTVTKPQTDIGVVFQGDALLEWRSAIDNVLLQVDMRRRRTPTDVNRARELLDSVGLGGFEKSLPHQLSGGMRQRVAICRALIHQPPVLLMDEPFGALDALTREQMMVDLQTLWASNGMSVLFITHSIPEAVFLSSRIVVMSPRPGRIVEVIESGLPSDRTLDIRDAPEFAAIAHRVRVALQEGHGGSH